MLLGQMFSGGLRLPVDRSLQDLHSLLLFPLRRSPSYSVILILVFSCLKEVSTSV